MDAIVKYENKDCFDFLKTVEKETVDLVLIDPPYDISKTSGFSSGKLKKFNVYKTEFGEWDYGSVDMEKVVKECFRVLKKSGTFICFYDIWKITELKNYLDSCKFSQIRFLEWIKTNPVPVNSKVNYLTNSREIALLGVKGSKPTFNSEYDNGIYKYPICRDKGRFHPTQKPLELIKELIKKHSNKGDLVLDCFCGSGTTAVASLELERDFYGCELSEEYFKKSQERINGEKIIF